MQGEDLAFSVCYEQSTEILATNKKSSKNLPLSISLDSARSSKTVVPLLKKNSRTNIGTLPQLTPRSQDSHSSPRSLSSRALKDVIGSKILQKNAEEASRFLLGSLLRPTAYVENGFVIGSRGIEKAPGPVHFDFQDTIIKPHL